LEASRALIVENFALPRDEWIPLMSIEAASREPSAIVKGNLREHRSRIWQREIPDRFAAGKRAQEGVDIGWVLVDKTSSAHSVASIALRKKGARKYRMIR
jgi:hypothetical protein